MKEQILESIKTLLDNKEKKWEAGKDMVNYAGPYFDSSEITSAIESLLDGWLVMGYKCMKFEKLSCRLCVNSILSIIIYVLAK